MYHTIDREECKADLLAADQNLRNDRAVWVKALESVKAYTGKQINKRLCTKIEEDAPREWHEMTRWNSETRQEEVKNESFPTYYASLEVDKYNYGTTTTQYKLTLALRGEWGRRRTFWFSDLAELVQAMEESITGADESLKKLMELEDNIDAVIDKYEAAAKAIEEINNIHGIYSLRKHFGDIRK